MSDETRTLLKYLEEHSLQLKRGTQQTAEAQVEFPKKISSNIVEVSTVVEDFQIPSDIKAIEPPVEKIESIGFDSKRFNTLLKSKILEDSLGTSDYQKPYFSVDEICSCIRKTFYERLQFPPDMSKTFLQPFKFVSKIAAVKVEEIVKKVYDFDEVNKVVVSEKFRIKDRVDAINKDCLVKLFLEAERQTEYKVDDYYKSVILAYILNTEHDYNIKHVTLVYFYNNFSESSSFDIVVKQKIAESYLTRPTALVSWIQKKVTPDPYGSDINQCNDCPYISFCEKDDTVEVKKPFTSRLNNTKNVFIFGEKRHMGGFK